MKVRVKHNGKQEEFIIQEMEALDYYTISTRFKLGQIDFKQYGQAIIRECIVSPADARNIEYFADKPRILDTLMLKIADMSNVGLLDTVEIETIED